MSEINNVLFIGSKAYGLRCLEKLYSLKPESLAGIMTLDDSADGRNVLESFEAFAEKNKIEIYIAQNRKESEAIISRIGPELCIVNGWYWMIGNETLNAVPHGFLGMHNSLLPKYRGGSPLVWTMINGEKVAGLSVFSFTEGMDEGDIWAQERVPIERDDYIGDVLAKLEDKAVGVLDRIYLKILSGDIKPSPQNHAEATYCAMRNPDDGLIDWNWPASRVYDFIRAQSTPYPGAFTYTDSGKVIIWRARPLDSTYYGTPGQVARISDEGALVICGDSRPILLEVAEYEGQKLAASKIIKSIKTRFKNTAPIRNQFSSGGIYGI